MRVILIGTFLLVNTVRTVAATKAAFASHYNRPINSIYRRFVEEFSIELHLDTVSSRFSYDPFFALGLATVFDTFMRGYEPADELPKIFRALCMALQLKPDAIRQDANKLLELLKSGDRASRLSLLMLEPNAPDVGGISDILKRIQANRDFRYSRTFLLGLYAAFEAVASPDDSIEKRTETFKGFAQMLNFAGDRVEKDLKLYRNNLERLTQAQAVMKDMAEAARRQKERQTAPPPASVVASASEGESPSEPTVTE
jgi:photosystem II biogenesis protein Psp29